MASALAKAIEQNRKPKREKRDREAEWRELYQPLYDAAHELTIDSPVADIERLIVEAAKLHKLTDRYSSSLITTISKNAQIDREIVKAAIDPRVSPIGAAR